MTRLTTNDGGGLSRTTSLDALRLSAVIVAWGKRDHLEPAKLVSSKRCDACLQVHEIAWEKAYKTICFECASRAIRQASETGDNDSVHSLHVLLDDRLFTEERRRS